MIIVDIAFFTILIVGGFVMLALGFMVALGNRSAQR